MKYLWTLIMFTLMSVNAMAGIKVLKDGDVLERGEYAVVVIKHKRQVGWNNKKVLVKAKRDFEMTDSRVEYGEFFRNGALELQRDATIAMGIIIPFQMRRDSSCYEVYSANSGTWIYHHRFKAACPPGQVSNLQLAETYFINGEKIITAARWIELGGWPARAQAVADAYTDQLEFDRLHAIARAEERRLSDIAYREAIRRTALEATLLQKVTNLQNTTLPCNCGPIWYYGGEVVEHLPNGGAILRIRRYSGSDYGDFYFNSTGELHREGNPAVVIYGRLDSDGNWAYNGVLTENTELREYWINGVKQ